MTNRIKFEGLNQLDIFLKLFNMISDLVFLTKVENHHFSYVLANKPAKQLWDLDDNMFGTPLSELLPSYIYHTIEANYQEVLNKKQPVTYVDKVSVKADEQSADNHSDEYDRYWESIITPVINHDGNCTYLLAIVRDITARKQRENELQRVRDRLELLWNSVADAAYFFDTEETFLGVNKSFEQIFGWTKEEILKDKNISIIPNESKKDMKNIIGQLKKGEKIPSHEVQRITKDGRVIDVLASYAPLYDVNGRWEGGVAVYKDITERKKYEEQLKQLAHIDFLTGLPNRAYFYEKLTEEINAARKKQIPFAVLFLDIDKFKNINDTKGHDIGDLLLKEFANRVKNSIRKHDTLARFGGDEFVILIPDLNILGDATEIAERIIQSLEPNWSIGDYNLKITTSIGIAFYSDNNLDEKTILKHADVALYRAKESGRNNYQVY
ncbi:sensor domain-containing diguanylate cyclase [Neobacillus dielmonensis]|uniref:sensor domain-containing diguanylate cyclase n=1 Tax=Neobacillus dielmonensis TaxID=1347369 RepID=UPI0005A72194|nr:sensor domain-containing diguanylate cyclase [Neobacillus dielmonensis]